jgi:hypothetical protein
VMREHASTGVKRPADGRLPARLSSRRPRRGRGRAPRTGELRPRRAADDTYARSEPRDLIITGRPQARRRPVLLEKRVLICYDRSPAAGLLMTVVAMRPHLAPAILLRPAAPP